MKIVIVYGNDRKGSTYNCVQIVKRTIEEYGDIRFEEIWLPKDLPEFCCGCFNCMNKGEEYCPHRDYLSPIIETILDADGVIMASPVYCLNVSGAMKTLIDHLGFMWIPHRPNNKMFSKIGLAISTAAGGGTRRTNKTMKLALDYMGFKRTYTFGHAVAASNWEDVKDSTKLKIEKKLVKKAKKYYKAMINREKLRRRLFIRVFFIMMKGIISGYEDGNVDKEYWRSKGWLNNVKPF